MHIYIKIYRNFIVLSYFIKENPNNQNIIQTSYCICKKPYKEGELMISCDYDQCGGWFHVECVGFGGKTEEEITKIKWYCSEECKEVFFPIFLQKINKTCFFLESE